MQDLSVNDLASMTPEQLAELQAKIAEAQKKQKLKDKYEIHKSIEAIVDGCKLVDFYHDYILKLEEKEANEIIPSILDSTNLLKFPLLMTLATQFPISEIDLRCGLVELFDSTIYHSDMGLIVNQIVPFDADSALRACRIHDPTISQCEMESFYRKLSHVLSSPIVDGESKVWLRKCMDDVMYIIHVISGTHTTSRFFTSLYFMSSAVQGSFNLSGLNTPERHSEIVEIFKMNGLDYGYSRRIASCFKIK